MRIKNNILLLLLLLMSVCLSCSSDNGIDNNPDNTDHGGLIAYCYQPLQNGIHQIYRINEDGTGNTKMIESAIGLNHHDWSPDGLRFACVGYIGAGYNTWSIHIFNADGTGLTRLTSTSNVWDSEPAWSPDGTMIAFTRLYDNGTREELWLMNSDGSNQHYIGVDGFAAKWKPDGAGFIFSSAVLGNYEIYSCLIDGSNIQQITNTDIDEFFPTYSPNGNQIAYCASSGEYNTPGNTPTFEIYTMSSEGTNIQQLTNNTSADMYPRWSPDGSKLVFVSDRHQTNKWEVYVMNSDGSGATRVTYSPTNVTGINPVWRPE